MEQKVFRMGIVTPRHRYLNERSFIYKGIEIQILTFKTETLILATFSWVLLWSRGEQGGLTENSVFHYILSVQRRAAVFFLLARHKMNML
jgi:hypothetical protein